MDGIAQFVLCGIVTLMLCIGVLGTLGVAACMWASEISERERRARDR